MSNISNKNRSKNELKQDLLEVIEVLKNIYPEAICSLNYTHPYELVIATRLSAQCTDARVNIVTDSLFKKYPTLESFANANINDVEEIIRPCGLGNTKAKDIVNMCNQIIDDFNRNVPDTINELLKLSGVGRKTANLIIGDIYGKPAIVCDTHCIRINYRLGFVSSLSPATVEKQLEKIIPPEESSDYCHRLVLFGREWCKAKSPICENCPLHSLCPADFI